MNNAVNFISNFVFFFFIRFTKGTLFYEKKCRLQNITKTFPCMCTINRTSALSLKTKVPLMEVVEIPVRKITLIQC